MSSGTSRAHIGTGRSPPCKESKSDESKTRLQNASVVFLFNWGGLPRAPTATQRPTDKAARVPCPIRDSTVCD